MNLIFEWDANKAGENLRKHGIDFDEAKTAFNDPNLVTYPDEFHSEMEDRYISIGYSVRARILLVVHTEHQERQEFMVIRIISCRKATALERKYYEKA